jgi:hypothetical protein
MTLVIAVAAMPMSTGIVKRRCMTPAGEHTSLASLAIRGRGAVIAHSLNEKPIEIGGFDLSISWVTVSRQMFADILLLIAEPQLPPTPA